jgi:hypothetical protein
VSSKNLRLWTDACVGRRHRPAAVLPPARITTGLVMAVLATIGGCGGCGKAPVTPRHTTAVRGAATSGTALLDNVVDTLNHLDRGINLELRPPVVILDATKSKDGKDVLATLGQNPRNPTGRFEYFEVPAKNGQFRKLGVRRGDRVRCFITDQMLAAQIRVYQSPRFIQLMRRGGAIDEGLVQSWIDETLRNRGETGTYQLELPVLRVEGESALLVQGGLPIGIQQPVRIEIWRYTDEKMQAIAARLEHYVAGPRGVVGWEPSPDEAVLKQVVDRLNQWLRRRQPEIEWRGDPLVETLPKELQHYASAESLAAEFFQPYDGRLLQEAVWLRDISRWAHGDSLDDVQRATRLFDWTVRNIELDSPGLVRHRPWQTLLYGRGNVAERAWVFLLLCRQQGLSGVMLGRSDPDRAGHWIDWVPAILSAGKLYLFEPALGLPIPGPGGQGVATLEQVADDDRLLRHLDLDADHPYPVKAADLKEVAALIVTDRASLSRRMRVLEVQLAGDDRLVLTTDPSALAERLKSCDRIGPVTLWETPYRTLASQFSRNEKARRVAAEEFQVFARRPVLWKARVLHFQGQFDGEEGAKTYYRRARPPETRIKAMETTATGETARTVRRGKMDASYWLGLLTFDCGQYDVAIDYFDRRTLQDAPNGPWTSGARYNLGRAYESIRQIKKAQALFQTGSSPQEHGNRLRARWIGQEATESQDGGAEE